MLQRCDRQKVRTVLAGTALAVLVGAFVSCKPEAPAGSGDPVGPFQDPGERFSVTLRWNAPDTDAEGNPLEDLAGYRLYFAPDPVPVKTGGALETGLTAEGLVTGLSSGAWRFGVTAIDTAGNESELSELVRVEVGRP